MSKSKSTHHTCTSVRYIHVHCTNIQLYLHEYTCTYMPIVQFYLHYKFIRLTRSFQFQDPIPPSHHPGCRTSPYCMVQYHHCMLQKLLMQSSNVLLPVETVMNLWSKAAFILSASKWTGVIFWTIDMVFYHSTLSLMHPFPTFLRSSDIDFLAYVAAYDLHQTWFQYKTADVPSVSWPAT